MTESQPPPGTYPLLDGKRYDEPSVFQPENLLREARRQKNLPDLPVPRVAVLDPDGDIARHLAAADEGHRHPGWACYHTDMWVTNLGGIDVGVVGMAVGAPFAVLVAEQLVASGAQLVISITSAGHITPLAPPPYFLLIDRAWRDEGTSAHYQRPQPWSHLRDDLAQRLDRAFDHLPEPVLVGSSWTTDAPYRETHSAIEAAAAEGIACVEMEAAALYAFAERAGVDVVCLAHVTNAMAIAGDDFEKGTDNGIHQALAVVRAVAAAIAGRLPGVAP